MREKLYTPEEISKALSKAYYDLNFDQFCEKVLMSTPRERDPWQQEMWERFKSLTRPAAMLGETYIERILQAGTEED